MPSSFFFNEELWIAETDAITGLPISSNLDNPLICDTNLGTFSSWNISHEDDVVDTLINNTSNSLYDYEFESSLNSELLLTV